MSRTLLSLAGFQVIISGRFWVIAEALLFLTLELNVLEFLGNFNVCLGRVKGRLAGSMSVARWLGSIPPKRREMLNRERLPQTRQ